MPLTPGTRLGPYEIVAPLGSGGMGEVYRARDTRLGREVAIKVLPGEFAHDPERRVRFEREARAISNLSHPNVCALFDVGSEDGVEYLVMELLAGETLAKRLERGRLPFAQTLRLGSEMASALAAAHAQGIVHRDLKPANVLLTESGAKLLDFGIAKALSPAAGAAGNDPTMPAGASTITAAGSIAGTAPYMAPEQLEGRPFDARVDVFALGAVLFEMATGRRAFAGESQAAVFSQVLTHDPPPVSSLEPAAPPAFDRLVRRCLAKDPAARWGSARDLDLQLREIALAPEAAPATAAPAAPARGATAWVPWAAFAAASVIALGLAFALARRPAAPTTAAAPAVRFALAPPPGGSYATAAEERSLVVSRDGAQIAYIALDSTGARGIRVRALSSAEARLLPGTEEAASLLWSPDGKAIAYFGRDKLKRIDLASGTITPICDLVEKNSNSGTWGVGGDILFSSMLGKSLFRVPAEGGKPALVATADRGRGQWRFEWPCFLPDGKRWLCLLQREDGNDSLLLFAPGAPPRAIMPATSAVSYTEPGYLVFVQDGALCGRRFDPRVGTASGAAFVIAPSVRNFRSTGMADFATSEGGTLVFAPRGNSQRLVWYDRAGKDLGTVSTPGDYNDIGISPDGRRLLFARTQPQLGTFDMWSLDFDRGTETRLTSHWNSEFAGYWLPDGRSILLSVVSGGLPRLHRLDLETGKLEPALPAAGFQVAGDLSPDGRTLAYSEISATHGIRAYLISYPGLGTPTPLLAGDAQSSSVRFSPDGRAIAYLSDESGSVEVYVQPWPGPGQRVRVSSNGASILQWPRAAQDLVYLAPDGRLMSVPIRTVPALEVGKPAVLFQVRAHGGWQDFDVTPDGRRILAIEPQVIADELPLDVIVNWPRALDLR
jgi:eukaryotic-like serine/threonine-protein kinase